MSDYGEPTLRDLLDDTIVRVVMASDGIAGEDVRRLIANLLAPPAANARRAAAGLVGAEDGRQAASAKGTEETPVRNESPLTTIGIEIDRPLDPRPGCREAPAARALRTGRP